MTSPAAAPAPDRPAQADGLAWHALTAERVLQQEEVDGRRGLSSGEAAARAERFGPNKFAEGKTESRWHAFIRQYADLMQLILLAAGIVSLYPLKELETGILLIALTLFNAVLGLRQEGKAAAAVAALQKIVIIKARVTRDGQLAEIPAAELVPGDVVSIEAGDMVPADGRLLRAATLEVAESALTGESLPVSKSPEPLADADTPLGDRLKTTSLDVQQWLVCIAVALSIVVASEIRKIILRRPSAVTPPAGSGGSQPPERASAEKSPEADQGTWSVPPQRHRPLDRSGP